MQYRCLTLFAPTPRAFEDYIDGCYSILLLPHSPLIIYRLELRDLVENRETSSANVDQTCRVRDLHVGNTCVCRLLLFWYPAAKPGW